VDCDGVINVGIRDGPGQSPLLLCESNLARCQASIAAAPPGTAMAANNILHSAASRQIGHGDEGTYSKFATAPGSSDICPLFAKRMADIVRFAGPQTVMVLSSSWRKPTHHNRVAALEAQLSRYSRRAISFEARTKPGGDTPVKRIELIGDFIHEYSSNRTQTDRPLRVVVLEDFAATHPRHWNLREPVTSLAQIEAILRNRSCQPGLTSVKLVHTYDEWTTDDGLQVQIGTGLTCAKVCEAKRFLSGEPQCLDCSAEEKRKEPSCSTYDQIKALQKTGSCSTDILQSISVYSKQTHIITSF
jgi:hypothetical protein